MYVLIVLLIMKPISSVQFFFLLIVIFSTQSVFILASDVTRTGDLIIDGTQVYELDHTYLNIAGNIEVRNSGTLIINNSTIFLDQTETQQFHIFAFDNAKIIMKNNSKIFSVFRYRLRLHEETEATIEDSYIPPPMYLEIFGNSNLEIINSEVGYVGTYDNSRAIITNSTITDSIRVAGGSALANNVEVYRIGLSIYKDNSDWVINYLTGDYYDHWNLYDLNTIIPIAQNLTLTNTKVSNWYVGVWSDGTQLTMFDSNLLGFSVAMNATAHLINTSVKSWTQVGADATLYEGYLVSAEATMNASPLSNVTIESIIAATGVVDQSITGNEGMTSVKIISNKITQNTTSTYVEYIIRATYFGQVEEIRVMPNENQMILFDFPPMIVIDEVLITDERCDIGSTQTASFHVVWAHNNSEVTNCEMLVSDEYGSFEKLESGKLFYDTFSRAGGTQTDEEWHYGFTWYGGREFNDGLWTVEDGKFKSEYNNGTPFAYPEDLIVSDFVWEANIQPTSTKYEGPEVRFLCYNENDELEYTGVFDYYNTGKVMRLMINRHEQPHSTYLTHYYEMIESEWYRMRFSVEGSNVKCYLNGSLIMQATDSIAALSRKRILLAGGSKDESRYWDDIKIWKSNKIKFHNTVEGQKIELYSNNGVEVASNITSGDYLELDVHHLTFPFEGYFKIYDDDGVTLLESTPIFTDIWGGDEYRILRAKRINTKESGWADIETTQSNVIEKQIIITDVLANGVTNYVSQVEYPTIIWDIIEFTLTTTQERVDLDKEAEILITGQYSFDGQAFYGKYYLNHDLSQHNSGVYFYYINDIIDNKYELSRFSTNTIEVVYDKVNIEIKTDSYHIDISNTPILSVTGYYESDSSHFDGQVYLQNNMTEDIGKYEIGVESILDPLYGLTFFESNSIEVILDRIKITEGGVSAERSNVGDEEVVWVKAVYEYDNEPFTAQSGVIYMNNEPMTWSSHDEAWKMTSVREEPGSELFEVTSVIDEAYQLNTINDAVGPLVIEWIPRGIPGFPLLSVILGLIIIIRKMMRES